MPNKQHIGIKNKHDETHTDEHKNHMETRFINIIDDSNIVLSSIYNP